MAITWTNWLQNGRPTEMSEGHDEEGNQYMWLSGKAELLMTKAQSDEAAAAGARKERLYDPFECAEAVRKYKAAKGPARQAVLEEYGLTWEEDLASIKRGHVLDGRYPG